MSVLPDVLEPGLWIVFCGTAAGRRSAEVGAYYAGRGNAFWPTLYRVGLTPRLLAPHEFRLLPRYGLGLTDLNQAEFGPDAGLTAAGFDPDGLRGRIERVRPGIVAFTSKRAGREFYGRAVAYGWQAEGVGPARGFVLPSPSGAARAAWDVGWWQMLAAEPRPARGEE